MPIRFTVAAWYTRHKGNYRRAIEDYDHAVRINPSYGKAFESRGLRMRTRATMIERSRITIKCCGKTLTTPAH